MALLFLDLNGPVIGLVYELHSVGRVGELGNGFCLHQFVQVFGVAPMLDAEILYCLIQRDGIDRFDRPLLRVDNRAKIIRWSV